ncbi:MULTISPECIES: aldehyde dehydrogenase family protein [unclassified Streptomyces]|uniref:aldehyde dehydrogenase family protein n=1 Tax=unclassified Streptomyces TaxID=2593676 RepID=UPI003D8EA128
MTGSSPPSELRQPLPTWSSSHSEGPSRENLKMNKEHERVSVLPTRLIIGDERVEKSTGGVFEHVNPTTGRVQRSVAMAGPQEIDRAVEVARAALPEWRRWTPAARRRVLVKLADLLREHEDELRTIMTLESGNTVTLTPWLVDFAVNVTEDAAGWAERIYGDTLPFSDNDHFKYSSPEPVGVVGVITTWNGSVPSLATVVASAMAAGCTVVAKPSELGPFGPLRFAELCLEAGIPAGVMNVVPGSNEAGEALVSHPGIDKIAFVGSAPVARKIAASAAPRLTPCLFELGGKSARLVFDDADIDRVVEAAMSVTMISGQACTMGSRFLVHSHVYDEVAERLTKQLQSVKIGDPFDPDTTMGPVVNNVACDRILGLVDRARDSANVLTGGTRLGGDLSEGFFIGPTLVADVDNSSELAQTEAFGPVLAMTRFEDEDDAIAYANDSEYGLAGYVFTQDLSRAHRVASQINAGVIGINGAFAPAGDGMPFGGRKSSGYGKVEGRAGVMEFIDMKTVSIRL